MAVSGTKPGPIVLLCAIGGFSPVPSGGPHKNHPPPLAPAIYNGGQWFRRDQKLPTVPTDRARCISKGGRGGPTLSSPGRERAAGPLGGPNGAN